MVKRKIIKIDEELCTGCGECIPNCPEGAIQLIDDKARIISDIFCDGLGACLGHCPVDAISIEEREAEEYSERKVMENVVKQGENVIKAHLEHLRDHDQLEYLQQAIEYLKENNMKVPIEEPKQTTTTDEPLPSGCPGATVQDLRGEHIEHGKHGEEVCSKSAKTSSKNESQLRQWPVQLMLVPPTASYLKNADLLITADCVPVADPNFHNELLKGKIVLLGCPKFDRLDYYQKKLVEIFKTTDPKSVTVAIMEVPCCFGLYKLVMDSVQESGVNIPVGKIVIGVKGEQIVE
jgi:Pyruvate/2-oxoacid:ferredoxin oxidoreductase delta subunit